MILQLTDGPDGQAQHWGQVAGVDKESFHRYTPLWHGLAGGVVEGAGILTNADLCRHVADMAACSARILAHAFASVRSALSCAHMLWLRDSRWAPTRSVFASLCLPCKGSRVQILSSAPMKARSLNTTENPRAQDPVGIRLFRVGEGLHVRGMIRNRHLSRSIAEANGRSSEFGRMLEYKTTWYGSRLTVAPRFYASTQVCSVVRTPQIGAATGRPGLPPRSGWTRDRPRSERGTGTPIACRRELPGDARRLWSERLWLGGGTAR